MYFVNDEQSKCSNGQLIKISMAKLLFIICILLSAVCSAQKFDSFHNLIKSENKVAIDSITAIIDSNTDFKISSDTFVIRDINDPSTIRGHLICSYYTFTDSTIAKVMVDDFLHADQTFYYKGDAVIKAVVDSIGGGRKEYYYSNEINRNSAAAHQIVSLKYPDIKSYIDHLELGQAFLTKLKTY